MAIDSVFINSELDWFSLVLDTRLKLFFNQKTPFKSIFDIVPPAISGKGQYNLFLSTNQLSAEERICLILSLVPILKPQLLDPLLVRNPDTGQLFTEFGCVKGDQHNGLVPTMETLLFILAGSDLDLRLKILSFLNEDHFLFKNRYLILKEVSSSDPDQSVTIKPSSEIIAVLLYGKKYFPRFSPEFPAKLITTEQEWEELILDEETKLQITEIKDWIEFGNKMLDEWQLKRKVNGGYRCLFHGPSGTGKTLTAKLLGKYTGRDVYRIDLSLVVSKYIGETEKNLSRIFDRAESYGWILFFDEADALFGKRTNIKDAHDRYANQEVSYLLQRIEEYDGLVILSTNLKTNLDEAFARRFQSVINFRIPNEEQRLKIWRNTLSPETHPESKIDLKEIAQKFEMTGGEILNVVVYCSLKAYKNKTNEILLADILNGIKRELGKEGRTMPQL